MSDFVRPHGVQSSGSSVYGILQARLVEWVAISSSRESSQPRDRTHASCVSCTGRWVLYHSGHLENPLPVMVTNVSICSQSLLSSEETDDNRIDSKMCSLLLRVVNTKKKK